MIDPNNRSLESAVIRKLDAQDKVIEIRGKLIQTLSDMIEALETSKT